MTQEDAVKLLGTRIDACFLCRWILEDLVKNRKLTGYPQDVMGGGIFPVDGKLIHLRLEFGEAGKS